MSRLSRLDAYQPPSLLMEQAQEISEKIGAVRRQVIEQGDVRSSAHRATQEHAVGAVDEHDPRLARLMAAIESRLLKPGFVGQSDAAAGILNDLAAAQSDVLYGGLLRSIGALGRVERGLEALRGLGTVNGLPKLEELIPKSYLAQLREALYPRAQQALQELSQRALWKPDVETLREVVELVRTGDAKISADAQKVLEPILFNLLAAEPSLEIAGMLAFAPPTNPALQRRLLDTADQTTSPALRELFFEAVGAMTLDRSLIPEATKRLANLSGNAAAAYVRTLARAGSSDPAYRRLNDADPLVQAAALDGMTILMKLGVVPAQPQETRNWLASLAERSTDRTSTNPISPEVKIATIHALKALSGVHFDRATAALSDIGHVISGRYSMTPPDPDPEVRRAAIQALSAPIDVTLQYRSTFEHACVFPLLHAAIHDPLLGAQALDGLRRHAPRDNLFQKDLAEELAKLKGRDPRTIDTKVGLYQLFHLGDGLYDRQVLLRGLVDAPEVREVALDRLLHPTYRLDWSASDLKVLEELVTTAKDRDVRRALAEVVRHASAGNTADPSPFAPFAALLAKV